MNQPVYKQKKRLTTFIYMVILLVGLSLTTGCTNIPAALGLGLASGISYYAYKSVNEKEDEKEKTIVEQKQQNEIEGSGATMEAAE
jgi:flagellar biosynthesis component FlhA